MKSAKDTCFHEGCDNMAPFGFRWPGLMSEVPDGRRGYLWACKEHIDKAEARRDAAVAAVNPLKRERA